MTDNNDAESVDQTPEPPKSDSEKFYEGLTQGQDYFGAPDRVLQKLADSADGGGSGKGIPITLFLHGGMIAGHITSAQEFYRAMADIYRQGVVLAIDDGELPEYADEFAKMAFDSVAEEIDDVIADESRAYKEHGSTTARWALTRQIYLTNAFYTVPGQYSLARDHVCVKLNQVVGWTFGVSSTLPTN